MGNTIKCCIACMLPCGALDVVRVLHTNGHVEEYGRSVRAGEVMKANPKHVLAQPNCQDLVHKTIILPPDAELHRGKIYFLIPAYALQKHKDLKPNNPNNNSKPAHHQQIEKNSTHKSQSKGKTTSIHQQKGNSLEDSKQQHRIPTPRTPSTHIEDGATTTRNDGKQVSKLKKRHVWRPMLQSISEGEFI